MNRDEAITVLGQQATEELKQTFSRFFKAMASGDRKAPDEFEEGYKLLQTSHNKAVEIIIKIHQE